MEWLRIDVGFPSHPKNGSLARALGIKRDAAAIAVLRLLCWAATTCEDGDLSRVHPDDIADAMQLRIPSVEVMAALLSSGWLSRDGERVVIHGWAERQAPLLAGRDRARRFRERRREERDGERNAPANVPANVSVTLPVTRASRYANGDLPTDLPKATTTHLAVSVDSAADAAASTPAPRASAPPIERLAELWRTRCPELPQPREWTDRRRKAWAARCRVSGWLDSLPAALDAIAASDFCRGTNDRGWVADVDWLLRPETVTRALEGKYAATRPAEAPRRRSAAEREAAEMASLGRRRGGKSEDRLSADLEALRVVAAEARPVESSYQILRAAEVRLSEDYADHPRAGELRGAITAAEIALDRAAEREAATC